MPDDVVMTAEDHRALSAELEQLQTVARAEIAERIKTAREPFSPCLTTSS